MLHELVEHFSTVGLEVEFTACPDSNDSDVPDAIRTAVFRICQEALTNCWKHSGCNKATVRIEKQGDCLSVEIDDDGHGFDAYRHSVNTGFGLKGMDARARLLGGSLHVVNKDNGTRVHAQLPLHLLQNAPPPTRTGGANPRPAITSLKTLRTKLFAHVTGYVLAAAFVGICFWARMSVDDLLNGKFFLTGFFYPAVVAVAYFSGLRPALLAAVISAAAIRYVFMQPTGQFFGFADVWDPTRLMFFIFGSSTLAFLISQLQASKKLVSLMASEAIRSRDQLLQEQELLRRLIDQQEVEKQALCNDFHDGLIQHVVGSKMLLEAQLDDLPTGNQVHEIVHHLGKGIADGRRVIRGIRPSVLDEPGLGGMLHELVEHFSTVGLEVHVAACPDGNDSDVPDAIRTAVFRICQEALTNSWKHSGCKKASVRIEKHGDCLHVEIVDDGHGIDHQRHAVNTGFGLKGMDARARLLGGSLDIVRKDKGTRVRAQLPLSIEHTACATP
jgi:signal transduction histidine kinase